MAEEATAEAEPEEGKKKGGKKKIIIILAVVAVVGIGASQMLGGKKKADANAEPTTTTLAEIGVVSLDPVTVSLQDGTYVKFDLGIRLVMKVPEKGEHVPEFAGGHEGFDADTFKTTYGIIARDKAAEAVTHFTGAELQTPEGQEQAKKEITHAVEEGYHGYVDEVYIVGFIIQ